MAPDLSLEVDHGDNPTDHNHIPPMQVRLTNTPITTSLIRVAVTPDSNSTPKPEWSAQNTTRNKRVERRPPPQPM
jgi:hypothetical protein